ncbi:HNH endonuclease [Candidatus Micrarchaeota archaeon]|nr:HNH endonuclease [Candidatus Micrarchaeota archaeon]
MVARRKRKSLRERNPDKWNEIRKKVYRRDSWTCRRCGATGVEVHAHHIVPFSKGGSDKLDNLETVCKDCHISIHPDSTMERESTDNWLWLILILIGLLLACSMVGCGILTSIAGWFGSHL